MRRMTNSIRRRDTTSLLIHGEVWNLPGTLEWRVKRYRGAQRGWRRNVGKMS